MNSDEYDTSELARIPSWTVRELERAAVAMALGSIVALVMVLSSMVVVGNGYCPKFWS